jgi:hypothetical protein
MLLSCVLSQLKRNNTGAVEQVRSQLPLIVSCSQVHYDVVSRQLANLKGLDCMDFV